MPKVSNRCRRRVGHATSLPTMSALLAAAPRKVSFEDNFPDCVDTGGCSSSTEQDMSDLVTRPIRIKSTLTRPKSSLSLVDLAVSGQEDSQDPYGKGCALAPVSPSVSPLTTSWPTSCEPSLVIPSSPWGQFVEMSASEEDATVSSHHHSYNGTCSCCSTCRRRRSNPYGCYQNNRKSPIESPIFFGDDNWSNISRSGFRLNQRKSRESSDNIIGAFHRLQVE